MTGPVIDDVRDDAALRPIFLRYGHAGLHRQEGALEIGVDHLVPLLARHVLELGRRKDAGIGAEHVEAAMAVLTAAFAIFSMLSSLVTSAAKAGCAALTEFLRPRPSAWSRWRATISTLAAGFGEDAGDALADALAAAGDDDGSCLSAM